MGGSNDIAIRYCEGLLAELRKQGAKGIADKARMPPVDPATQSDDSMPELSDDDLAAIESASGENPMPDEDDENPLKKR